MRENCICPALGARPHDTHTSTETGDDPQRRREAAQKNLDDKMMGGVRRRCRRRLLGFCVTAAAAASRLIWFRVTLRGVCVFVCVRACVCGANCNTIDEQIFPTDHGPHYRVVAAAGILCEHSTSSRPNDIKCYLNGALCSTGRYDAMI